MGKEVLFFSKLWLGVVTMDFTVCMSEQGSIPGRDCELIVKHFCVGSWTQWAKSRGVSTQVGNMKPSGS